MSDLPKNPEISISEQLSEVLSRLSRDQLRFVTAMQEFPTKREAAEAIGLEPNTIYKWPKVVDDVLYLIAQDRAATVREVAKRHLLKAMMVKVAGLDSDDESIRQKAATEVLEMILGKPTQPQEIKGELGYKVYQGVDPDAV